MAKKADFLTVTYLDDLEAQGRTQVTYNIRPDSFNSRPQFKGVSTPANKKGEQESNKDILAAAQAQTTKKLAIGFEDVGLVQRVTYLYDTEQWANEKVVKPGLETYGKFWVMTPVTSNVTTADGIAGN